MYKNNYNIMNEENQVLCSTIERKNIIEFRMYNKESRKKIIELIIQNKKSKKYIVNQLIQLYIKTPNGDHYQLHMRKQNTIMELKKSLSKNYKIPFENILLYKMENEMYLDEINTLESYNIYNNSTLFLILSHCTCYTDELFLKDIYINVIKIQYDIDKFINQKWFNCNVNKLHDKSNWKFINTDKYNRVTVISMKFCENLIKDNFYIDNTWMTISFPLNIDCLSELVSLNLINNYYILGEQFFINICKLRNLRELLLECNAFTCIIPDEISQLNKLQSLNLANCELYSNIPEGIVELKEIKYLNLTRNNLTIPKIIEPYLESIQDCEL